MAGCAIHAVQHSRHQRITGPRTRAQLISLHESLIHILLTCSRPQHKGERLRLGVAQTMPQAPHIWLLEHKSTA